MWQMFVNEIGPTVCQIMTDRVNEAELLHFFVSERDRTREMFVNEVGLAYVRYAFEKR